MSSARVRIEAEGKTVKATEDTFIYTLVINNNAMYRKVGLVSAHGFFVQSSNNNNNLIPREIYDPPHPRATCATKDTISIILMAIVVRSLNSDKPSLPL
jgi:hypothetical protein